MNGDAAIWLAAWIILCTGIVTFILVGLGIKLIAQSNAELARALRDRKAQGKMVVKPIKLYSVPENNQ
jgi:hypothetical protein